MVGLEFINAFSITIILIVIDDSEIVRNSEKCVHYYVIKLCTVIETFSEQPLLSLGKYSRHP